MENVHRSLVAATLIATAGCSSGTGQSSLAPGGASTLSRSNLLMLAAPTWPVHQSPVVTSATHATYPTKKSLLYVSDFSNDTVNIYQTNALPNNPAPVATIAEPPGGCPYQMALNNEGDLYLADECLHRVEIYPKGSTRMSGAITKGLYDPFGVAIDKNDTLYVSSGSAIKEYAKGSTSPTKAVTGGGMNFPFGLSLDKRGNLYIADYSVPAVFELTAGGSSVTNLGLANLTTPIQVAVDWKLEHLWVADASGYRVSIYQLGSSPNPIETIGAGYPFSVSIQNEGKLEGTAVYGDSGANSIYAFTEGSYTPYASLNNGIDQPTGLLIGKP
jgi:hypothetical protein